MTEGLAPEPEALASTYLVLMVLKAFRALVEQQQKKILLQCVQITAYLFMVPSFCFLYLNKWASGFVSFLFDFFFFFSPYCCSQLHTVHARLARWLIKPSIFCPSKIHKEYEDIFKVGFGI